MGVEDGTEVRLRPRSSENMRFVAVLASLASSSCYILGLYSCTTLPSLNDIKIEIPIYSWAWIGDSIHSMEEECQSNKTSKVE